MNKHEFGETKTTQDLNGMILTAQKCKLCDSIKSSNNPYFNMNCYVAHARNNERINNLFK